MTEALQDWRERSVTQAVYAEFTATDVAASTASR
jgi:hypothetical protein